MSATEILKAAKALPLHERVELARVLSEDLLEQGYDLDLAPEQVAELDRRAEEALQHPGRSVPAEQVFAEIDQRLRAKQ